MVIAVLGHYHLIKETLDYTEDEVAAGLSVCVCVLLCVSPNSLSLQNSLSAQNFIICIEMFIAAWAHHKFFHWKVCETVFAVDRPRVTFPVCLVVGQEFHVNAPPTASVTAVVKDLIPHDLAKEVIYAVKSRHVRQSSEQHLPIADNTQQSTIDVTPLVPVDGSTTGEGKGESVVSNAGEHTPIITTGNSGATSGRSSGAGLIGSGYGALDDGDHKQTHATGQRTALQMEMGQLTPNPYK